MKVLYLFNRCKAGAIEDIAAGRDNDDHFFGMLRLPRLGIGAEYLELEQFVPKGFAFFLRKYFLNIYYLHLPLFFKFRAYDIVFTSTAFGSLLLKAVLRLKRPKWVMFDYSVSGLMRGRQTLRKRVFRFAVRHGADGIVTISRKEEGVMRALFPEFGDKIRYLPLGTDTEFFKPDRAVPEDGGLLSAGRDPFRDYGLLLRAVAGLSVPVLFTTKPGRLDPFKPLPPNVETKFVSMQELLLEYRRAKIVVIPLTTQSGLNDAVGCSTLVEAMAMGKAIIATRTFTIESYITDGVNGILVPEGDEAAMRAAILDLLSDEQKRRRLGRAAEEFALAHCKAEQFARSLKDYFLALQSGETN